MDISPLPHKAPFSFLSDLSIPSPTPEAKNDCEDMLAPCTLPPSNPLLEVPRPVSAAEYD
jgi:M-phase inducer tyrosine phosphatase